MPPLLPEVLPGVFRWSAYSPAHKVELTSHAVWDGTRCVVFDPIPLPEGTVIPGRWPDRIVLTNENHGRDAAAWCARFKIDAWASSEADLDLDLPDLRRWDDSAGPLEGWDLIRLPGGPGGETAFHFPARSLVVFGDAVVHLPGRGLELLPDKYCQDPARLRASLRQLPTFENAVFAHGDPLLGNASTRIAELL